ncbi:MAG: [FeFe] hydrogenase H-cluster maturation GTPase HydF [Ruminococcaceae bacterium]|nr:[FeFe] hydrogenase H-cluster maturation GTPase HydF [Oscillospiraceae bacterium]
MNKTPNSMRKHIGIFGDTNSGKSALFNKIINQELAIVSDKEGTTTDPVKKAMELIGLGPVVFVDTAGTSDFTELGALRNKKTFDILKQVDYALLVIDYKTYSKESLLALKKALEQSKTPYSIVISKNDMLTSSDREKAFSEFEKPLFVSVKDEASVEALKSFLINALKDLEKENGLLDGLAKAGDNVVLVIPTDSEAPEGRIILPQVQTIRACLDIGAFCHIANENNLPGLLEKIDADLVITDSQAFKKVNEIVPVDIRLTSFSMLLARQKGEFSLLFKGAEAIEGLKDGDCVLISEVCTHNTSHEDIAKVKIPALLKKKTGKELRFEFSSGFSFPDELSRYALVIHCGGCMITKKAMSQRLDTVKNNKVPVTNFGVALAYLTGAYNRQNFLLDL